MVWEDNLITRDSLLKLKFHAQHIIPRCLLTPSFFPNSTVRMLNDQTVTLFVHVVISSNSWPHNMIYMKSVRSFESHDSLWVISSAFYD